VRKCFNKTVPRCLIPRDLIFSTESVPRCLIPRDLIFSTESDYILQTRLKKVQKKQIIILNGILTSDFQGYKSLNVIT